MSSYKPLFRLRQTEEKFAESFPLMFEADEEKRMKLIDFIDKRVQEREEQRQLKIEKTTTEKDFLKDALGSDYNSEDENDRGRYLQIDDELEEMEDGHRETPKAKEAVALEMQDNQKFEQKEKGLRPSVKRTRQSRKGRLSKRPDLEVEDEDEKSIKKDEKIDEEVEKIMDELEN